MGVNEYYLETSWKRPNTGERVTGFGDREEPYRVVESSQQESEPDFPKPAEGDNRFCYHFPPCYISDYHTYRFNH